MVTFEFTSDDRTNHHDMHFGVPLQSLILIMSAHYVGDYVLQNNTIAEQKGKVIRWLLLHVVLYTIVLIAFALFIFSWQDALLFSLTNGLLHFVTDFISSRFSMQYKSNHRIFYLIVGFDQLIHALTLLTSIYYFSGAI